jgi:hypothetical protein
MTRRRREKIPVEQAVPSRNAVRYRLRTTLDLHHPWRVAQNRNRIGRTDMHDIRNTWENTVRTAANTMLRHPDRISDGLEAELYALLEKLDTTKMEQPESTGKPDDAA